MMITKLKNNFVETHLDNEVVLMNVNTGSFYALKSTGLAIWNVIGDSNTKASIVEALTVKFSATATQCDQDVTIFLAEIEKAGFVTLV